MRERDRDDRQQLAGSLIECPHLVVRGVACGGRGNHPRERVPRTLLARLTFGVVAGDRAEWAIPPRLGAGRPL